MQLRKILYVILLATAAFGAAQIHAETWNYQSYSKGLPSAPGYVTLEENNGEATLRMVAGNLDQCLSREMKATVERTESIITITTAPVMVGCEEYRFVIKADGTGGTRAHKTSNGEWVLDKTDRKMTIRN